jgi:transcription elongation factor GreA
MLRGSWLGSVLSFFVFQEGTMSQRETYLTTEGLAKLEIEIESLRNVRRSEIADRIQRAKEIGGTVDNVEYDEAKNEQAFVEGRVLTLENMIKNAVIIPDHSPSSTTVEMGSKVTVVMVDGKKSKYTIVGRAEADPTQGRISNESPVGKVLLGTHPGDDVEAETPAGKIKLRISKVE